MSPISRRRFLTLTAGAAAAGLAGCSAGHGDGTGAPATTLPTRTTVTTALTPTTSTPAAAATDRRILVVVQMNGGNDWLNTLVPASGRYRDLRPTLAVPEAELLPLAGTSDAMLHPALAPLVPMWEAGTLAAIAGVGFAEPDRSHFVSMERWWRADDLSAATGWLGRWLDGLDRGAPVLVATALGGGAPLLVGEERQPAVILSPASFRLPEEVPGAAIRRLATPRADGLSGQAQTALAAAAEAVDELAAIVADVPDDGDVTGSGREGAVTLASGLELAAALVGADVGVRTVVVSAGGFDTHANQLATQQQLLSDYAAGVAAFWAGVEAAGRADDVLMLTTTEFGRRVAENGSGGTDHGAGSSVLVAGSGVVGGLHGEIDLDHLLDGDIRPVVDPRVLYTGCLDWLGGDAEAVLGRRFTGPTFLRR
jgi:uncharacterized protein (DUF1501 family)